MNLLFNLVINGIYLYFFISILVNQYYSIRRFIKVCIRVIFNKFNMVIILMSLVSMIFLYKEAIVYYLLNLSFSVLFIVINKPIKFNKTRRNITLLLLSLLFSILIVPIINVTSLLILLISYLILLPIENAINNKYIFKAKEKLKRINPLIIGVTGSYGKTTFKNILYDVLKTKYLVEMTSGNINTPLGITKYINQFLKDETEIFIVELGIDTINGMDKFKKLLSLDIGIKTSIGENHLANFKNKNNTFKAKMKISNLLKEEGKLYLNNDDEYLNKVEENGNIIKFSKTNIKENKIDINGLKIEYNNHEITIPLYGKYLYSYLDGIIKIGEFLGLNEDYITLGLKQIRKVNRRLEVSKYKDGYFLNDSYNININGVKESIDLLNTLPGENVVIIGGIIEQGKEFVSSNNKIKELLENQNVVFIGELFHPLTKRHRYKHLVIVSSLKEAYTYIDNQNFTNVLLLAKSEDIYLR